MSQPPRNDQTEGLLAFEDSDFLWREEMRASRIALEFQRAELRLRDHSIKSTVVVFGSARAYPRTKHADHTSAEASQSASKDPAAAQVYDPTYWYQEARAFGRLVSESAGALAPTDGVRENVITTGGGPGIMEAANRGAADAGAPTIGFNIHIPEEQEPNQYITPELNFHFHYFAVRKMHFAMRANALAVFPGGYGTLDEMFEILTLKQTHKTGGMPVVLFGREYWRTVVNFERLAEFGTIDATDLDLFEIVDSAQEGLDAMVHRGLASSTPLREV